MRRKMRRAITIASTIVLRPGSVSTMSADARACNQRMHQISVRAAASAYSRIPTEQTHPAVDC